MKKKEILEKRLSFRITDQMSYDINKVVSKSKDLRNRSDFGVRAVEHYIKIINQEDDWKKATTQLLLGVFSEISGMTMRGDTLREKYRLETKILSDYLQLQIILKKED